MVHERLRQEMGEFHQIEYAVPGSVGRQVFAASVDPRGDK